jgi:hypothetical protein
MKDPVQKKIIDAEALMRSDYDLWLEQQDEDTKLAHKMGEI